MQINNSIPLDLNIYTQLKPRPDQPTLVSGTIPGLSHPTDTVEISPASRQLAASDVVHHAAVYFGTAQINESLQRLLQDQSAEVKEAVYGIIQSNFITQVAAEDDAAALLELGLAQAQYVADQYMKFDQAAEFMKTIREIGAISTTRTVDPDTQQVRYVTPAQRPVGAPEDYIDLSSLMQKFEPDTFQQLQDAIVSGGDWSRILTGFARKAAARQDWAKAYQEDAAAPVGKLPVDNRFDQASRTDLTSFVQQIKDIIASAGLPNSKLLTDNIEAFMRKLL